MKHHRFHGCRDWLITIALTLCTVTSHAATDYIVAPNGGDITGAALSAQLATGEVILQSSQGKNGGSGNVIINDIVTWSANTLSINALGNISINTSMKGSGTASLALVYGQSSPAADNSSNYFINVPVTLPAGQNFSTTLGTDGPAQTYTVITSLGTAADATIAPARPTLQGMAEAANLTKRFALGSDIDGSVTSGWNGGQGFTPIGSTSTAFSGTLEGLGHSVGNLMINRPNAIWVGLIGQTGPGAMIRNIGIIGGSIKGLSGVGGLTGLNRGGTLYNSFSTATISGYRRLGGLVGDNEGPITNSYATGNVSSTGSDAGTGYGFGGLVGRNYGQISNSHATGIVSGGQAGMTDAGGLVGENYAPGAISYSYATGSVSGGTGFGGMNFGGLVGVQGDNLGDGGSISNSYSTGNVSCNITPNLNSCTGIGGLIGAMGGNGNGGGLTSKGGTVADSYTAGVATSNDEWGQSPGGLVGFMNSGTVTNSYWNSANSSGTGYKPGGTITGSGLTTQQMKTTSSFTDFNFTSTPGASGWVIVDSDGSLNNAKGSTGGTLPILASEYSTTITNIQQLQLMAMAPAEDYTLSNDINGSSTGSNSTVWGSAGFIPVGNTTTPYTGTFDGLGHIITDLSINQPTASHVGLFGTTSTGATIKNVGVMDGSVSGNVNIGGLVGYLNDGTLSNSYFTGNVSGSGNGVGGLAGASTGNISVSCAMGSVDSPGNDVGGLVGNNSTNSSITNCYAANKVSGGSVNVGGLAGGSYQGASITNSYAAGSVSSTGNIVGGLVGGNLGNVSNSYWNTTTSGQTTSAGGTGLTSAQMMMISSFKGWSIANAGGSTATWRIYEDSSSPLLRDFLAPITLTPAYDSTTQTLNNIADYAVNIPSPVSVNIIGSATGLTLSSSATPGSYTATWDSYNFVSNQHGYDINVVPTRTITGSGSGANDLDINAPLTWSTGTLTLNAQGNINLNASLTISGAGGLVLQYGQGSVAANNTGKHFINAPVNLPAGTSNFTTKLGTDGTVTNYRVINTLGMPGSTTASDLQGINGNLAGNYALGSDIDATATAQWDTGSGFTPINGFSGTFDGLGHTINNLSINLPSSTNVGLFGNVDPKAAICNLGLLSSSVSGGNNVGGLVGYLNGSEVSNSFTTGRVRGSGNCIGGLVGNSLGNGTSSITNSYALVDVTGINDVGGLVGYNGGGTGSTIITSSYASGSVSGSNQVGGLVGHSLGTDSGSSAISNSYATCSVSGSSNVGGLAGQIQANGTGTASIRTSYAAGPVIGSSGNVGGLVGLNTSGSVSSSYWNMQISGQDISAGGAGLSGEQMLSANNFIGFDFKRPVWVIVDNDGTLNHANGSDGATSPMLAAEYSTSINNAHQLQLMTLKSAAAYTLNADIDATGTSNTGDVWGSKGFAPVGGYSVPFSGIFDGQGHTISNLTIYQHKLNRVGLFGVIDSGATVENTTLAGGTINGYSGSIGGLAGINYGALTNCRISVAVKSTRGGFVGGMIGSNNGTISNCQASGNVSGSGGFRGGVAGMNNGTISSCNATGMVTGHGGYTGQLAGENNGTIR